MKHYLLILGLSISLWQCSEPGKAEPEAAVEEKASIVSEKLIPYAFTAVDSVYAMSVKIASTDSVVVEYSVQLIQDKSIHKDSLVFSIPKGEQVLGEIIFTSCPINNNTPSYTSKLKIIERR